MSEQFEVVVDNNEEAKVTFGDKVKKHKSALIAGGLVVGTAIVTVIVDHLFFDGRVAHTVTEVAEDVAPFD